MWDIKITGQPAPTFKGTSRPDWITTRPTRAGEVDILCMRGDAALTYSALAPIV